MRKTGKLKTERNTSNKEITGRATTPVGAGHTALQVGRPTPMSFGVRKTARPTSFVRNRSAGWAGKMDDLEAFEADFAAPFFEIGRRIVERVAEFKQHVQRHEPQGHSRAARCRSVLRLQ